MNIEWIKVSRRRLNAILKENNHKPYSSNALHGSPDGINHTVHLLHHTSTKLKLHELGHIVNGHNESEDKTWYDVTRQEIEAEAFMYSKMGKPYDIWLPAHSIWLLIANGGRPSEIFKWVIEILAGYFIIGRKHRSELWTYITDYYKEYKKEKREGDLLW